MTELSFATTLPEQSKIDLASNATAHRHMRLLRLSLTDFRNYAALTWRPGARISVLFGPNGSGKTNLLEAVSLLVPGRALRGARNADLPRHGGDGRLGGGRPFRHGGRRGGYRHRQCSWTARPIAACSASTAPHRAARRRSPPMWQRCGSRRRWTACSRRARPAGAAFWTGWCGRWNLATRARSRHTTPPWRSAIGCWRIGGPIRAGLPGWRMRWRGTRWRLPRRAWRWWRG